ncbi:MAG TPA: hypothetical protein VKU89_02135 [Solirubrobacteraceae bacterium]|nr:hypothetical protein [Solirubrobacteraceae bacterium]
MGTRPRPAFYALPGGGWRDLLTLLHPPYTAWHLSYVAIGAALAPHFHGARLLATLAGFFLGVGICAHALDELKGRPLQTQLSSPLLAALATVSLLGAIAIGAYGAAVVSATLIAFIVIGSFLLLAYNLELFGGRFHSDLVFALSWGAFPVLTAFWAAALTITPAALAAAGGCFALSLAQRRLSTPARELRRRTASVGGEQRLLDGSVRPLSALSIAAPLEGALRACSAAVLLLAVGLVAARL